MLIAVSIFLMLFTVTNATLSAIGTVRTFIVIALGGMILWAAVILMFTADILPGNRKRKAAIKAEEYRIFLAKLRTPRDTKRRRRAQDDY